MGCAGWNKAMDRRLINVTMDYEGPWSDEQVHEAILRAMEDLDMEHVSIDFDNNS